MNQDMFESLSLVDLSGYIIITAILALLVAGVTLTFWLHRRYGSLDADVDRYAHGDVSVAWVVQRIAADTVDAFEGTGGEVNTQAIVERNFHTELRHLLLGERFLRASIGLMIILGLVGTFYGLTLSIGKLVRLVSGDLTTAAALTQSLTQGLTEALAGMSVAFSTSLFGIVSAILMTLLGVFFDIPSRRTATMVRLEAYLDNVLLKGLRAQVAPGGLPQPSPGQAALPPDARMEQVAASLGQTVHQLHTTVGLFDQALQRFSGSTREFQEINLHLKDNIQRMSLSFGDLSSALKESADSNKLRGRN